MGIHNVCSAVQLSELSDKCTRAAKARERPARANDQEAGSSHGKKNQKRKTQAVLMAEPKRKPQNKKGEVTPDNQDDKPYCALHNSHTHETVDCCEFKKLGEEREKEWRKKRCDEEKREGSRGRGRAGKHGGRGGRRDRPPQGCNGQKDDNACNNLDSNKEGSE